MGYSEIGISLLVLLVLTKDVIAPLVKRIVAKPDSPQPQAPKQPEPGNGTAATIARVAGVEAELNEHRLHCARTMGVVIGDLKAVGVKLEGMATTQSEIKASIDNMYARLG